MHVLRPTLALLTLLAIIGCGPTFFSAKGTLASTGGSLDQWSQTPIGCHRDVFDGDTSKLVTFSWANPNANDPDRAVHDKTRPAFPILLSVEKDGASGLKGHLQNSRAAEATFSSSTCKTFTLTTRERSKGFAEAHPSLDGSLTLDCTTSGSHITSDVAFKHCD